MSRKNGGIVLGVLLLLLAFMPPRLFAGPSSQQGTLCDLNILPSGAKITSNRISDCNYEIDSFKIQIHEHNDLEAAIQQIESDIKYYSKDPTLKKAPVGEDGYALSFPPGYIYNMEWRYGCYRVWSNWPDKFVKEDFKRFEARLLALNQDIYNNLRKLPPCHSSSGSSTPPPTMSSLGVKLSCQTNNPDPALVICTAQATGAKSDALLSYQWTMDGKTISATSGRLELAGVSPGLHTVAVVANDTRNSLSSAPQNVSFAKSASSSVESILSGSTSFGGSSNGGIPTVGLVLVGGGILGALALVGGLGAVRIATGRKRPAAPIPPGVPTRATTLPNTARPANLPKVPAAASPPKEPPAPKPQPVAPKYPRPSALPEDPILASKPKWPPIGEGTVGKVGEGSLGKIEEGTTGKVSPGSLGKIGEGTVGKIGEGTLGIPVEQVKVKPPELRPEKPKSENEIYYFVPETDVVRVRGDNQTRVPVRIRVLNSKGEDASGRVTCSTRLSHPDKISCSALHGNVHFEVWARHLGVQPFTDGTITVSGTAPNGKPLREVHLRVRVDPVELKLHLLVWKKGFTQQEVEETLGRGCAFIGGFVGASRDDIGDEDIFNGFARATNFVETLPETPTVTESVRRSNLHPVAFARCRAELKLGDAPWSAPQEAQTDSLGRFRFAIPFALVDKFGGRGVTEQLMQPAELHLHPELVRELDRLRAEINHLPQTPTLDLARRECLMYPRQFFEQLCGLASQTYESVLASLGLLRASVIFSARYRQDYVDQRPMFKRALGETFGCIITLVLFTSGLLKGCYEWISGRASGWIQAVSVGLKGSGIPQWVLRVIYAPVRVMLRGIQNSVRWALTKAIQTLSHWQVIKIPPSEVDEVWERLTKQVHDRIWTEYNTGRRPNAPEEGIDDGVTAGLLGLWEMVIWMVSAFWWFLMNVVLRTVAWLFISAAWMLGEQLDNIQFLLARVGLRKVFYKYIDQGLKEWAKEVDKRVSIVIDGYNETGEFQIGLMRLSGALMNRISKVERIDEVAATALHAAYLRSCDREVPERWQENMRLAAGVQAEFLKSWQNAAGWVEFLETVDRWTQLIVKTVVQGGAYGLAHAMEKTEGFIAKGMSRFALQSIEAYARDRAEFFTKIADLPSKAADLLQAFIYARITLKEYMQLLAIKEGLPLVIALLYDAKMEEMTGTYYDPAPQEGEEEPEPLRLPEPSPDEARLSRLRLQKRSLPGTPSGTAAAAGFSDVVVLKRVRDFLAQPDEPEDEDKLLTLEATQFVEQMIQQSGVAWTEEQKQVLIRDRIETIKAARRVGATGESSGVELGVSLSHMPEDHLDPEMPDAQQPRDGGQK